MITEEKLEKFWNRIQQAKIPQGGGKVGFDSADIRRIVAEDPETASGMVDALCKAGNFQLGLMIAAAYQAEFKDDSLMLAAQDAVKHAGEAGEKALAGVGIKPGREPEKGSLRILKVEESDLASGNVSNFIRLFGKSGFTKRENARILRGNCLMTFDLDSDPRPIVKIPSARAFTRRLHQNVPHFPYFLSPEPKTGAMWAYFGCLVPEDLVSASGGYNLGSNDFLLILLPCLESIKSYAIEMEDDPSLPLNNVLSIYPEDMRKEILGMIS